MQLLQDGTDLRSPSMKQANLTWARSHSLQPRDSSSDGLLLRNTSDRISQDALDKDSHRRKTIRLQNKEIICHWLA